MKEELEKYIIEHSSPEKDILNELYRLTHTSVVNPNMLSGHLQGKVLEMIVSMINPDNVLEIGTYTGYSAICIASSLKEGAMLHTIEVNDELKEMSSSFIEKAGLSDRITMHTGNAIDIIPGLDIDFDLAFIDGDKRQYPEYLNLVLTKLKSGAYILADNVLWDGKVADPAANDSMTKGIREFNKLVKENQDLEKVILPLRDGLMLIKKS